MKPTPTSTRASASASARRGAPFGLRLYALSKAGAHGAASLWSGDPRKPARYAVSDASGARLVPCASLFEGLPAA